MTASRDSAATASTTEGPPPDWLRHAVREVLQHAPAYHRLQGPDKRDLAKAMVKISAVAAALIVEEGDASREALLARQPEQTSAPSATKSLPLARAQDAPEFGTATDRIASTTRNVLAAVSFPRFVTDLINGVFKAMLDSSSQQMQMYVQLLNNVSASAEGFEKTQFSMGAMRQWVADHFPDQIEYDAPETEPGEKIDPEELADIKLRLKPNASMPGPEELRAALGLEPQDPVDVSNPEQLVPLARRQVARQRQQMLATMVMMGMQRIVIDSGRINASMRFHIDTRSAASDDKGSQFGLQNRVKAQGSFGMGPWGASAEVENTISYVSTQRSQNTEEINTDVDLNSSVEINFRTDYLPLNKMAAQAQADRVRNATLNPAADTGDTARQQRMDANLRSETARRTGLDSAIDTASRPAPSAPTPTTAPAKAATPDKPASPTTSTGSAKTSAPPKTAKPVSHAST